MRLLLYHTVSTDGVEKHLSRWQIRNMGRNVALSSGMYLESFDILGLLISDAVK